MMETHVWQTIYRNSARAALLLGLAAWFAFPTGGEAYGHEGRRFLIEVVDNKLQAQGINSGDPDTAPPTRPYLNSIHDHWSNVDPDPSTGLEPFATSFLPDFGIPIDASFVHLRSHELTLELLGASKWQNPPLMPTPGTTPDLVPLDPGEEIRVESVNRDINTSTLGTLLLSASVPAAGVDDIVLNYFIEAQPDDTIHVLTFQLAAAPADPSLPDLIDDSDPIYILLSPDGATPVEKLHQASLYLEQYLGTHPVGVPEPGVLSLAVAGIALWIGLFRGRRSRSGLSPTPAAGRWKAWPWLPVDSRATSQPGFPPGMAGRSTPTSASYAWTERFETEDHWRLYWQQLKVINGCIQPGSDLLEIGPGTGFTTNYLRSMHFNMIL